MLDASVLFPISIRRRMTMKQSLTVFSLVLAGVLFGAALGRETSAVVAAAGSIAPTPAATMHGGMMGCPAYQDMMRNAKSPVDHALMQSMMSMHRSMESMRLTGDADHDFLAMMIPHHQMAVAMAKVELQSGKDPRVVALAKSIISAQQKEIDEMQGWLH